MVVCARALVSEQNSIIHNVSQVCVWIVEPYYSIYCSLFAVATIAHIHFKRMILLSMWWFFVCSCALRDDLCTCECLCAFDLGFRSPKSYGSGIENKYKISRSRRHHHRSSVGRRVFVCIFKKNIYFFVTFKKWIVWRRENRVIENKYSVRKKRKLSNEKFESEFRFYVLTIW